jgi:hypothetical protein
LRRKKFCGEGMSVDIRDHLFSIIGGAFGELILEKCGFLSNEKSEVGSMLKNMKPRGKTAFLDSYLLGLKRLMEVYGHINDMGCQDMWKFVYIVLTDGQDNASQAELSDIFKIQMLVGLTLGDTIKTWLLGVDVDEDSKAGKTLQAIAAFGGNSCELGYVDKMEIENIFQKIIIQLGLQKFDNKIKETIDIFKSFSSCFHI